jgi:LmbE family N-acetylglucosaminyl deacetylase
MNVLVIAAHPDDEILGCGATMARMSTEGHNVAVLILGEGVTSRSDSPEQADRGEVESLREASRQANRLCGVEEVSFADFPDNRFDTVPLLDVVKRVERVIDEFAPSVVFTQHGGDLNVDHVVTHRATLTATRPMAGCGVETVHAYEVNSSTEWGFGQFTGPFQPTVYYDVSETLAAKIEAMKAYSSEMREFPHPRSVEAMEALARVRGSQAGLQAAEAFELVRRAIPRRG